MATKQVNLKGGVLIIGSLLWQDHLEKAGDDIRKNWRNKSLLLANKIQVKTPIRYGRFSDKSKIYTMVFSNACKRKSGTAFIVPFSSQIQSDKQLVDEAQKLSEAEGMKKKFVAGEDVWSVLGILINPKHNGTKIKRNLIALWNTSLNKAFDDKLFRIRKEKPCIKSNGILNIPWPSTIDPRKSEELSSYDFIIATATKPTKYPLVKELAGCVKNDAVRYYFIENYKSGITTFQDLQVINS
jgi:hypothetical protein